MAFNEAILAEASPNFFELLAEEALREALRPALLYLIKVFARSRPHLRFSAALWRSRDEVHLLTNSFIQGFFLSTRGSSFSEHYYGLRRRVSVREKGEVLTKRRCFASFLCLVVIPYLKVKFEHLYSVLSDENDSVGLTWREGQNLHHALKVFVFKLTPFIQALWALIQLTFRVCYLMQKSAHYSALHWLAGVNIVHDSSTAESSGRLWQWMGGQLLSLFLFSLRLLQWWYSGEHEAVVRNFTSLPVPPPPPHTLTSSQTGSSLPSDPKSCPLCHQTRRNPTVLASSGFVFCYDCISEYLTSHDKCPITASPSSQQQLVQLFLPDSPDSHP